MTDYSSAIAKFTRAEEHVDNVIAIERTWRESEPVALVGKRSDENLSENVYVALRAPLPPSLGPVLGDAIHNLRSTLDHLAMALAIANGANHHDRSVSFPVCSSPDKYFGVPTRTGARPKSPPVSGAGAVSKLTAAARGAIEALQPYNRGPYASALSELQYLDNVDKHRRIISSELLPGYIEHSHGVTVEYAERLRLEDGAHFATIRYVDQPVHVELRSTIGVVIEHSNGVSLTGIDYVASDILPAVRGILDAIVTDFP